MNKEELIGKLQMVYVGDKNALNELIGYYDGLKQVIEELQQENKQLKEEYNKIQKAYESTFSDYQQLKDKCNKLKEYFNERIEVCDNRLSSPFCNFEKATKERLIFSQCLEKLEELEGSDE
ncbi:MAG: hypothetical protein MSA15_19185 [Clostridium sp.]|nr:hypothetical protein [Clostridium sp.]